MKRLFTALTIAAVFSTAFVCAQEDEMRTGGADPASEMMSGMPGGGKEVRIIHLNRMDPEILAKELKVILGPGMRISAYPRTKSLVVQGSAQQLKQIEKLISMIEPQTGGGPMAESLPGTPAGQLGPGVSELTPLGEPLPGVGSGPMGPRISSIRTKTTRLPISQLQRMFADSERRSQELALRYREAARQKSNSRDLAKFDQQLTEAVSESFSLRQDLHRAQVAELENKLEKMKSLLATRDKIKQEIIDRRAADLKNPARRWEQSEPVAPAGPPQIAKQVVPMSGVITAVSRKGLVEISLGTDDGIKPGQTMTIIRKGLHVGRAEIVEVIQDRSVARITSEDKEHSPVKKGDQVQIQTNPGPGVMPPMGGSAISSPGPAHLPLGDRTLPDDSYLKSYTEEEFGEKGNAEANLKKHFQNWAEAVSKITKIEGTVRRFRYDGSLYTEKRGAGGFFYERNGKALLDVKPIPIEEGDVSRKVGPGGKRFALVPDSATHWIYEPESHGSSWSMDDWENESKSFSIKTETGAKSNNSALSPLAMLFSASSNEELRKQFEIRNFSEDLKGVTLELVPNEENKFTHWSEALVRIDKKLSLPTAIQFTSEYGRWQTVYTFSDLKINGAAPKALLDGRAAGNDARDGNPTSDASVQLKLAKPQNATVLWTPGDDTPANAVILPVRINVPAENTAIFQLENLPSHPNLMLFGSFANLATKPAARTYARHNAVSIDFTDEDVDQAASGNLVVKVFYVPKSSALAKLEVLASHRLDPGIDPVKEAEKRGEVVGVLRLGNRHGDVGKNDDWHLKFLEGHLKNIRAEEESVREELAILEDHLLTNPKGPGDSRETIQAKLDERKEELTSIEARLKAQQERIDNHKKATAVKEPITN